MLKLAMNMVAAGTALCVPGNHDVKLLRKLRGKDVQVTHGLGESLSQLEIKTTDFATRLPVSLMTWSVITCSTTANLSLPMPASRRKCKGEHLARFAISLCKARLPAKQTSSAPSSRVRVRSAGAGERAGGSAALAFRSGSELNSLRLNAPPPEAVPLCNLGRH